MVNKSYNTYKKSAGSSKSIYNRQLNKVIFVLIALIIILIIKTINNNTTNNIIRIVEKNIYYDFSWQDDGKNVVEYIKKMMGNTKDSIEIFNMETNKKLLNR